LISLNAPAQGRSRGASRKIIQLKAYDGIVDHIVREKGIQQLPPVYLYEVIIGRLAYRTQRRKIGIAKRHLEIPFGNG
jgi:hypothetical protein